MEEFAINGVEWAFIIGALVLTVPILYFIRKVHGELKKGRPE